MNSWMEYTHIYIYTPIYIYTHVYIYMHIYPYIYTRIHSGERWEYRVLERYLQWPRKIHIVCWYWRFVIVSMGPSYFFGVHHLIPYSMQGFKLITSICVSVNRIDHQKCLRDFPATFDDTGGYLQWWYLFPDYQAIESQKVDVSPVDFK